MFTFGVVTPVTGPRPFSYELLFLFNFRFGRSRRRGRRCRSWVGKLELGQRGSWRADDGLVVRKCAMLGRGRSANGVMAWLSAGSRRLFGRRRSADSPLP